MKRNAIMKLIKDVVTVAAIWIIAYLALKTSMEPTAAVGIGMFLAGLPFGWRWISKIVTAVTLQGIGIKALVSVGIGWIAIFFTLVADVIRCIFAKEEVAAA